MNCRSLCVTLFCISALVLSALADSPSDYFSDHDAAVARRVVLTSQRTDGLFVDMESTHFGVSTLHLLGTETPQKPKICAFAKETLEKASDVSTVHHAVGVQELLGCGAKVGSQVLDVLERGLEADSLVQIYHSVSALASLKKHGFAEFSEDVSGVAKAVHDLLEADGTFRSGIKDEEGSALSTGYAYHILALLKEHFSLSPEGEEHVASVAQTVDDFFSTAREDDGMLEFTDLDPLANLKATSLVWTGANELARVTEAFEITQTQIVGLAEYFVKNKYITNVEDAHYLLSGLKVVQANTFNRSPLVLTLPKSSILTSSKGDEGLIKILVTDIFGHFATNVGVYIVKVYPVDQEKQIILRNQQALPVSDGPKNLAYSFNFLATKPDQGFYSMEFSVSPLDRNSPYFPVEEAIRTVKVVAVVELADATLQISDSKEHDDDSFGASNPVSLQFPNKLAEILRANIFQTVQLSFRAHASGRPIAIHQAFLRFTNVETHQEAVFVAELQGKKYKFSVNLKDNIDAFQGRSGKYAIALILGDSLIQNPIAWEVATLNIQFGKFQRDSVLEVASGPLPEIVHQFRAPDKRPPPAVSFVFTALVLAPFLFFLVGLTYVGANLGNFPSNPTSFFFAAGFQVCIGSLFGLFIIYWLRLTMVQTLCYLLGLALVTVFFGQYALRYVASLREHKKTE